MNGSKLRAAVIGLGGMGRRHLQALRHAKIEASALCDTSDSALQAAALECAGAPRRYLDWRALLENEARQLDLVTIATNGPSHHEIAVAAARAGARFILCEKPMATSGQKARHIAQVCSETGTRLAVNMSRRFTDRFIRLRQMLKDRVIGDVRHVNVSVGAGGLGCIGTHYFDFVAWLTGATAAWLIGELDARPAPNVRGPQFHDPGGRGMAGYTNGMTACFQFSESVAITPLMQVVGSDGYVDFNGWAPPARGAIAVFARPEVQRGMPKTRFVEPQPVPFELGNPMDIVIATAACIEDLVGRHEEETAAGGIAAVDMVIAFHLSAHRGLARVELPLAGGDLQFDVPIT